MCGGNRDISRMEARHHWFWSCFSAGDDRLFLCARQQEKELLSPSEEDLFNMMFQFKLISNLTSSI